MKIQGWEAEANPLATSENMHMVGFVDFAVHLRRLRVPK